MTAPVNGARVRLLVLGGTAFVGRAIVAAALADDHHITTFTRGQTDPDLWAGRVEQRHGDRAGDLDAIAEGFWDAVVDVTGYLPEQVSATCELLHGRVERYAFISTGSTYAMPMPVLADEESPLLPEPPPGTTDVDGHYGPLKVACERVVRDSFGDAATIIRPGIVFGPHDTTDRATWWVRAAARASMVIAPASPEAWTQVVDARDLGAFAVRTVTHALPGPYNVVGTPINLADFAGLAIVAAGTRAQLLPVTPKRLQAAGVRHADLPLWVERTFQSFKRRSHARAANDGLRLRPMLTTLRDIARWDRDREEPLAAGMPLDRLADLAVQLR